MESKEIINDFINSIDTKLYDKIRKSKGDAECRRYLKEHLESHRPLIKDDNFAENENVEYVNHKAKTINEQCLQEIPVEEVYKLKANGYKVQMAMKF